MLHDHQSPRLLYPISYILALSSLLIIPLVFPPRPWCPIIYLRQKPKIYTALNRTGINPLLS